MSLRSLFVFALSRSFKKAFTLNGVLLKQLDAQW